VRAAPRFILMLTVAFLYAAVAHAQATEATGAVQTVLQQGAWGGLVILEGLAILLLFRDLKIQHGQTLEWAVKATDVLATTMSHAGKTEASLARVLEQVTKSDAIHARVEGAFVRWEALATRLEARLERGRGGGGHSDG
jgi:hypothetical protein